MPYNDGRRFKQLEKHVGWPENLKPIYVQVDLAQGLMSQLKFYETKKSKITW